jgi:hypothetical protein
MQFTQFPEAVVEGTLNKFPLQRIIMVIGINQNHVVLMY